MSKKLFFYFSLCLYLLLNKQSVAQIDYFDSLRRLYDTNFFQLCHKTDSFFLLNPSLVDSAKGGYKSYNRYKNFWMPRVDNNGKYQSYINDHNATGKNIDSLMGVTSSSGIMGHGPNWCINSYISDWKQLGYNSLPDNGSAPSSSRGMGWVSCIWADPNFENVLYAGSNNGGLWKSSDFNTSNPTWSNITQNQLFGSGVQCIAVNPHLSSKSEILISVSMADWVPDGIYRSTNSGATWSCVTIDEGYGAICQKYYVRKIVYHPTNPNIVYAIQGQRFLVSNNGGSSFTTVRFGTFFDPSLQDPDWIDLEVHVRTNGSPRIIITSSNANYIFYSDNGGTSFYNATTLSPFSYPQPGIYTTISIEYKEPMYAVSGVASSYIYRQYNVIHKIQTTGGTNTLTKYILEKSIDNGNTWVVAFESTQPYSNFKHGFRKAAFEISKINPNIVYVAGVRPYILNTNVTPTSASSMGSTFQIHNDIRGISLTVKPEVSPTAPYMEYLYLATDGGVIKVEYNHTLNNITPIDINGEGLTIQQTYDADFSYINGKPTLFQGLQDNANVISTANSTDLLDNYESSFESYTDYNMDLGDGGGVVVSSTNNAKYFAFSGWSQGGVYNIATKQKKPLGYMSYNHSLLYNKISNKIYYYDNAAGYYEIVTVNDPFNPSIFGTSGFYTRNKLSNFILSNGALGVHRIALSTDAKRLIFAYYQDADQQGNKIYITDNADEANINNIIWTPINNSNLPLNVQVSSVLINPENKDEIWLTFGYTPNRVSSNIGSVYFSDDGGLSWTDVSNGLDDWNKNLGVNSITIDEATAGPGGIKMVYAATDFGVYYRNNLTSTWIRFSDNLPYALVSEVIIDQENRKLIAITYGRGSWYTDIPCCTGVNTPVITVQSNQTWEGNKAFYNNVIIQSGNTLTLTNGCFSFNNSGIVVQPGGTLIVQNSILQSACKSFWGGITINGNPSGITGFARLENSTLRDAYRGIVVGDLSNSSLNAGSLHAYNTKFINNRVGIFFKENTRTSIISECEFLCTRPLIDNSGKGSLQFISLFGANGVNIRSSKFKNSYTGAFSDLYRGTGIVSIDATYTLDVTSSNATQNPPPDCFNFDGIKNNFEGLSDAVSVYNLNTSINSRTNILEGNYHNNVIGIKTFGSGKKVINKNYFDWDDNFIDPDLSNNQWDDTVFGIKMTMSPTNHIDSNAIFFLSNFSSTNQYKGVGIKADYTNDPLNRKSHIYLTDILKLGNGSNPEIFGAEFIHDNPTIDISCSKFTNLTIDWKINVTSAAMTFASPQPASMGTLLFSNQFSFCPTSPTLKNIETDYPVTVRYTSGGLSTIGCVDPIVTPILYNPSDPNHVNKPCNYTHPCVLRNYDEFEPGTIDYVPVEGPGGGGGGEGRREIKNDDFEQVYSNLQNEENNSHTKSIQFQGNEDEKKFLQLIQQLKLDGRTYSQLSPSEIETLRGLLSTTNSLRLENYISAILQVFAFEVPRKNNESPKQPLLNQSSHPQSITFKLIPNPARDNFKVTYSQKGGSASSKYKVVVSTLLGAEIYQGVLLPEQGELQIKSESWSSGVYFVQVFDDKNQLYVAKVIIIN